jgi:hypothetical protein
MLHRASDTDHSGSIKIEGLSLTPCPSRDRTFSHAEPQLRFIGRKLGIIRLIRNRDQLALLGSIALCQKQVVALAISQHFSIGRPPSRFRPKQWNGTCQAMKRTTECGKAPKVSLEVDGEKVGSIGRDAKRSQAFGGDRDPNGDLHRRRISPRPHWRVPARQDKDADHRWLSESSPYHHV